MSDVTIEAKKPLNVFQAIQAVMADMGAVGKDGTFKAYNNQTWQYRKLDDLYNALHPQFAKHGLFTVPHVLEITETTQTTKSGNIQNRVLLKVRYDLHASDGSNIHSIIYGEGTDSGDKAVSKALSFAYKYFLMQTFCVALESEKEPDSTEAEERVIHIDQAPQQPKVEAPRLASTMTDLEIKSLIWPHMQLLKIEAKYGLKIVAEIKKANIAMNDLGAVKSTLATLKRIVEEQA